ncbi:MAG: DUF4271 domain-containing protein [Prolixibacteraceae bacterium]|nr:DUF4271 domain-containing protein [Prolixibacteraceae bacterium]
MVSNPVLFFNETESQNNPGRLKQLPDTLHTIKKTDSILLYSDQDVHTGHTSDLPVIARNFYLPNWSVFSMLFMFALLASMRHTSDNYLAQLFQAQFKKGTISRLFREKVSNLSHVTFRLDILFYMVSGLFVFHFLQTLDTGFQSKSFIVYLACITVMVLFLSVKFLLYRLSGLLFDSYTETRKYIFYTKTGNRLLGLLLLPLVITAFFTGALFTKILLFLGGAIAAIVSIVNVFRGIEIVAKKVFSIYYMILYLCSLEILPLLLVWRILWRIVE